MTLQCLANIIEYRLLGHESYRTVGRSVKGTSSCKGCERFLGMDQTCYYFRTELFGFLAYVCTLRHTGHVFDST